MFPPLELNHPLVNAMHERGFIREFDFIKQVAAIAGDIIHLQDGKILINGEEFPLIVQPYDREGNPIAAYPTPLIIYEDYFWLTSCPIRGLDSRYFGPVHRSLLSHKAFPIF